MNKAQDAGILSRHSFRFSESDRLMQMAAKAEADPKLGKKAG
jgi:hypothetical protein